MKSEYIGSVDAWGSLRQLSAQLVEHVRRGECLQFAEVFGIPGCLKADKVLTYRGEQIVSRQVVWQRGQVHRIIGRCCSRLGRRQRSKCRHATLRSEASSGGERPQHHCHSHPAGSSAAGPNLGNYQCHQQRQQANRVAGPTKRRSRRHRRANRNRQQQHVPPARALDPTAREWPALQHLMPTCSATTPALMLWTSVWPNPAACIIAFNSA